MKILTIALLAASGPNAPVSLRSAGELGPRLAVAWAEAPAERQTLMGKDKTGKSWRISLPGPYATVFAGDLDRNGQEDLLVVHPVSGEPVCGTSASDVTLVLRDAEGRPAAWQSTMRLARAQRDEDVPFLVADRNGDGFAEIAVTECVGETPALEGIYEVRPEGVVPVARRAFLAYANDLRKLYRNKSFLIPAEDAPMAAASETAAGTLDRVTTRSWGGETRVPLAILSTGQQVPGWPRLGPAQAGFQRSYSTGDSLTDLLEIAAQRLHVRSSPGRMLRTQSTGNRTRVPLMASLVTGQPSEREIAFVDAPVPASVRDVSFFVAPGKECFAMHVGNSRVGAMHSANCDAAASLRTKGLTDEPFVARNSLLWQTNPASNEWRIFDAGDLPAGASTIRLNPVRNGKLAGAAWAGEFVLAQWRDAGSSWLTLHLATGEALTGALPVPPTDQLMAADEDKGLIFLRWENGKPTVWREVPAHVEWQAASN